MKFEKNMKIIKNDNEKIKAKILIEKIIISLFVSIFFVFSTKFVVSLFNLIFFGGFTAKGYAGISALLVIPIYLILLTSFIAEKFSETKERKIIWKNFFILLFWNIIFISVFIIIFFKDKIFFYYIVQQ